MAGPKAPIGLLSTHSAKSANLARSASANNFRAASDASAKRTKLKEESDSDSSGSDSDSSDAADVDHDNFLRNIQSKQSGTKSKTEAKAPAPPAVKPTVKSEPATDSKTKKNNTKTQTSSSEESSSESESESEEESSSGSEDEQEAVEPGKGAKLGKKPEASVRKNNAKEVKKAGSEDESDSESTGASSSSESESEEGGVRPAKKAVPAAAESKAKSKAESSSSSDTSESESSSSESDEEADESMAIDQRNGNNALSKVPEVVSDEFHLRKAEDGTNAADVAKFFSEAQKEGKQIWYFTAPASIPIEVVEKLEIPLERAQKGQSILSHNGDDYGVAFEDAATSRAIKLLIPSKAGDQYRMLNAPIAQTMHLKRVTQFSQSGESTLSLTQSAHTSTARPPRPQPKGLKARFQPIGVANGSSGSIGTDASDEDVDMTEAPTLPSSQKTPAKKNKDTTAEKKRKLDAATDVAATPGTDSKKSKKARVETQPTPKAKSETHTTTAGKVTPIAPPVVPSIGRVSSSQAPPASTPSSSKASKTKALSASQPTPVSKPAEPTSSAVKKESAIPLPPSFQRASSSSAPQAQTTDEPKTNGKIKKEKKSKAIKAERATEAPKKTTPVPLPNIPS